MTWLAVKAFLGGAFRFLRSVPLWVWVVAAIALAAFLYGEKRYDDGAASRDGEVASARQTAAAAVASNATLRQTMGTLQRANAEWASKNAADLAAGREAVAAVERERDALQAEVDKRRADRNRLYDTDQSAAAWGRTVVPSAVAAGLRK